MNDVAVVQIVGAPVACADGVRDTWREVATWAGAQLRARFGEAVRVEYYDLFDPHMPALPAEARLPLVLLNGAVVSSGGKVSVPAIRRHLEILGCVPLAQESPAPIPVPAGGLADRQR